MAAVSLVLAFAVSGCASQTAPDPYAEQSTPCPRHLKLQCYKRTAQPEECRCVTQMDDEETFENIIGDGPH